MITIHSLFFALAILFGLAVWRAWYNGRENVAWLLWAPLTIISIFLALDDEGIRQLLLGVTCLLIVTVVGLATVIAIRKLKARHQSEVTDLAEETTIVLADS